MLLHAKCNFQVMRARTFLKSSESKYSRKRSAYSSVNLSIHSVISDSLIGTLILCAFNKELMATESAHTSKKLSKKLGSISSHFVMK